MSSSIYERRKKALDKYEKLLKSEGEEKAYISHLLEEGRRIINIYVSGFKGMRKCVNSMCDEVITSRNHSGYCRKCYRTIWRHTSEARKLDAERAREYRKNKKRRIIKEIRSLL
jgi:hypothetical protein